ncbi:unnamed protein product [Natator depressus]
MSQFKKAFTIYSVLMVTFFHRHAEGMGGASKLKMPVNSEGEVWSAGGEGLQGTGSGRGRGGGELECPPPGTQAPPAPQPPAPNPLMDPNFLPEHALQPFPHLCWLRTNWTFSADQKCWFIELASW